MAKAGRGQTRRDSKRRVLRSGESVRADGKYQYKYHIDGKPHFVYSWKLEPTIFTSKSKSVFTCFSNSRRERHGFLHFGSLSVGSSFQLYTKCGFPSM